MTLVHVKWHSTEPSNISEPSRVHWFETGGVPVRVGDALKSVESTTLLSVPFRYLRCFLIHSLKFPEKKKMKVE